MTRRDALTGTDAPNQATTPTENTSPSAPVDAMAVTAADVDYLASAASLVVAMDFDGTLAHFSDDPYAVRALPGALKALGELAALPGTVAMIISGRNLELLSAATELDLAHAATAGAAGDGVIRLVGSHGAECAQAGGVQLSEDQRALLERLDAAAQDFADRDSGMWVERKPFAVGLHTRAAEDASVAAEAVAEFYAYAEAQPGAKVTVGKDILEVAVTTATKGGYLQDFLSQPECAESVVVFAGDDTTDETVMEILRPSSDIGIKVGPGDTAATRRLETPEAVRDFLVELARRRH